MSFANPRARMDTTASPEQERSELARESNGAALAVLSEINLSTDLGRLVRRVAETGLPWVVGRGIRCRYRGLGATRPFRLGAGSRMASRQGSLHRPHLVRCDVRPPHWWSG